MTTAPHDPSAVADRIREVFDGAGAEGFLHAREIAGGVPADTRSGGEVAVAADEPVVLASVFKIVVSVAFWREVVAGRLDPAERTAVTDRYRVGGIGTAGCADDVAMSWRDLALFMMTMSDNAATDTIYHRVGQQAVDAVIADLGLDRTRLVGCCEDLLGPMADELGIDLTAEDAEAQYAAVEPDAIWSLSVLDPARTTASTPRQITTLLEAIWTDRAAPAEACGRIRAIMAQQIWPHRLSSGFDNGVQIAAKTGTLPAVRNEAGVVQYPDGHRYAVAVFTRARSRADRQPAVDGAIGRAARIAVDHLRAGCPA
jgi:beta-lactamase class A